MPDIEHRACASTLDDPAGWLADDPGTPPHFAAFAAAFQHLGFPAADLTDGGAISTHDSILVAVRAVRMAMQGSQVPTAADVFGQMLNLNNEFVVPCAGGDLSFSYHGTGGALSSNPIGKPVPVIVVPPSAAVPNAQQNTYVTTQ